MSKEAMKLALALATIHHTDDEYPELRQKVRRLAKEALAEQQAQQEPGVKGYSMALNEIALKLRERYKTDLLSTPLWADFEKARNKLASRIAAPQPAQQEPLIPFRHGCKWCGKTDGCEHQQPAQREPVAFPTRKAVEREIERTTSPTGMHLNDGKERVALPGGTLRHMLALIDRTSPPQRTWVGLSAEEVADIVEYCAGVGWYVAERIEAKLKEKNT